MSLRMRVPYLMLMSLLSHFGRATGVGLSFEDLWTFLKVTFAQVCLGNTGVGGARAGWPGGQTEATGAVGGAGGAPAGCRMFSRERLSSSSPL